jgi:hypothetical protein
LIDDAGPSFSMSKAVKGQAAASGNDKTKDSVKESDKQQIAVSQSGAKPCRTILQHTLDLAKLTFSESGEVCEGKLFEVKEEEEYMQKLVMHFVYCSSLYSHCAAIPIWLLAYTIDGWILRQ